MNDKAKFDLIPKTIEEYVSVTHQYIRFKDSYRFSSISLDYLIKTLVDNSYKSPKNFKKEIVDVDKIGETNHSRRDDI